MSLPVPLDVQALSGIAGSISIACWLVVFSPQIIENFRRSSAEGLSIRFVVVWLSGDVFNVLGGVLQGVLPTMIILAVYYMLADIVLLSQCFYYKGFTLTDQVATTPAERTPLLSDTANGNGNGAVDGTHLSPAVPMHATPKKPRAPRSPLQKVLFNGTAVLLVVLSGALGWLLSTLRSTPATPGTAPPSRDGLVFVPFGQLFGYVCALLYLGSRAPQLLLNYRRKSTEGISMLFFVFACVGNLSYVVSVLAFRPACGGTVGDCPAQEERALYARYVAINASWLAGSFGTFCLDLGVFAQWWAYRSRKVEEAGPAEERAPVPAVQPVREQEEQREEAAAGWHDI